MRAEKISGCGLLIHFEIPTEAKIMNVKKRVELRSIGHSREAVPKMFLGILVVVICGIVGGRAKAQPGGGSQALSAPEPKKAEKQFKDIQVFKGIPADELIPTMQF